MTSQDSKNLLNPLVKTGIFTSICEKLTKSFQLLFSGDATKSHKSGLKKIDSLQGSFISIACYVCCQLSKIFISTPVQLIRKHKMLQDT